MQYSEFTIKDRAAINAVVGTNKLFDSYQIYLTENPTTTVNDNINFNLYELKGIPSVFSADNGDSTLILIHHALNSEIKRIAMLRLSVGGVFTNTAVVEVPYGSGKNAPSVTIIRLKDVPFKHFKQAQEGTTIASSNLLNPTVNEIYYRGNNALPSLPHGERQFGDGVDKPNITGPALIETAVALSPADVVEAKNTTVSMIDVFNRWQRFSHRTANFPSNEALPSELTAWVYDEQEQMIRCTVNSTTLIGFISPDSYENYDLDVTVGSNDVDDDNIGIVIAAKYIEGKLWTLILNRSCGGGNIYGIMHGWNYSESNTYTVREATLSLKWGNGNYGINATEAGYVSSEAFSTNIGWKSKTGGVRLTISRRGDIFTIMSSDLGSTEIIEGSKIVLNLNSHARYAKFKGPARYGYSSSSQNDSYYKVTKFVDYDKRIVDISSGVIWKYDGESWVVDAVSEVSDILKTGRFIRSTVNGKLFFSTADSGIIELTK